MQGLKDFIIDLLKVGSVIIGFTLLMTLIGYSLGGKQRTTNGINDYYNNIDYSEEMNIDKSMSEIQNDDLNHFNQ